MGSSVFVGRMGGAVAAALLGSTLAACSLTSTVGGPTSVPHKTPPQHTLVTGDPGSDIGSVDACLKDDVTIEAAVPDNGTKSLIVFPLRFTNTGGKQCTLTGPPDVAIAGGDGSPAGEPATKSHMAGQPEGPVLLKPGAVASAPVGLASPDSVPGCDNFEADGYAVTLPGDSQWTTVHHNLTTCTNQPVLQVGPIRPGPNNTILPGQG